MSVILETTLGDLIFDLYTEERPNSCKNFLKLCKMKYYNFCLFHSIRRNFIAQSGDPTGKGKGGESIYGLAYGEQSKYFPLELKPRIKHKNRGIISFVNNGNNAHGSQFFITLGESLDFLDGKHTVFGQLAEGFDVLEKLNESICDEKHRPFQDVRISHTIVLEDPFDDPKGLLFPDRSPELSNEQLDSGMIGANEAIDETAGKTKNDIEKELEDKDLQIGTKILETIGDIDDAEMKPPENVLFVCKLNPVTNADDLQIIFSRFGNIVSCEIIKDQKTGDSLCFGFVEFEKIEDCEKAYFKMDNVLIDDRRIHVDFCQSVAKLKWKKSENFKKKRMEHEEEIKRVNHGYKLSNGKKRQNEHDDGYSMVFEDNYTSSKGPSKKYEQPIYNTSMERSRSRNYQGSSPKKSLRDKSPSPPPIKTKRGSPTSTGYQSQPNKRSQHHSLSPPCKSTKKRSQQHSFSRSPSSPTKPKKKQQMTTRSSSEDQYIGVAKNNKIRLQKGDKHNGRRKSKSRSPGNYTSEKSRGRETLRTAGKISLKSNMKVHDSADRSSDDDIKAPLPPKKNFIAKKAHKNTPSDSGESDASSDRTANYSRKLSGRNSRQSSPVLKRSSKNVIKREWHSGVDEKRDRLSVGRDQTAPNKKSSQSKSLDNSNSKNNKLGKQRQRSSSPSSDRGVSSSKKSNPRKRFSSGSSDDERASSKKPSAKSKPKKKIETKKKYASSSSDESGSSASSSEDEKPIKKKSKKAQTPPPPKKKTNVTEKSRQYNEDNGSDQEHNPPLKKTARKKRYSSSPSQPPKKTTKNMSNKQQQIAEKPMKKQKPRRDYSDDESSSNSDSGRKKKSSAKKPAKDVKKKAVKQKRYSLESDSN